MVHNKVKLEELISAGADLSKVVTICVEDMAELFDRTFTCITHGVCRVIVKIHYQPLEFYDNNPLPSKEMKFYDSKFSRP